MKRQEFLGLAGGVLLSTVLAGSAQAQSLVPTTLAGIKFEPEVTVAGQKLQLNGAGVRIKAIFRVYAAGLYTTTKMSKSEDVIKMSSVKRMHLVALRDVKGDEFGRLFAKAMEENSSKEEFAKTINGVIRMGQIFADARNFSKGDVIILDFIPGTGVIVTHKGKQLGEPFKEQEFMVLLIKTWFGNKPVDEALRRALLGEQSTANTNMN